MQVIEEKHWKNAYDFVNRTSGYIEFNHSETLKIVFNYVKLIE